MLFLSSVLSTHVNCLPPEDSLMVFSHKIKMNLNKRKGKQESKRKVSERWEISDVPVKSEVKIDDANYALYKHKQTH